MKPSAIRIERMLEKIEATLVSRPRPYLRIIIHEGLRTLNGRVVSIEGGAPPKNVALIEWDSLDDAVAFYKSKAWTDLAPQRDKSHKTIRRYVVEVEK